MSPFAPRFATATTRSVNAKIGIKSRCRLSLHATGEPYVARTPLHTNDNARGAVPSKRKAHLSFENTFVRSLVLAGACQHHRTTLNLSHGEKRKSNAKWIGTVSSQGQVRSFTSREPSGNEAVAIAPIADISKDEYKQLVNTYPAFDLDQTEKKPRLTRPIASLRQHYPLAPRLVLTPEQELGPQAWHALPAEDVEHERRIKHLETLLKRPLGRLPLDKLWKAYTQLRSPRPRYLTEHQMSRIFAHLSWVEFRTLEAKERYFKLLDECVGEQVPLSEMVWNTAIDFAGRWSRKASDEEVKAAIEVWMRMEESGFRASNVTFNILFQVAIRAGRYALADTIFDELKVRDMPLDRYLRSSLIYYAGVRRDGDGVRHSFRELVNAGDIVDTGVMNVVILSFFRAGEAPAAEHTFYRMKELHDEKFKIKAPEEWQTRKQLSQLLNKTGARLREEQQKHEASFFGASFSTTEKREEIQKASPIAPNAVTYQILIKHHTYTSGNMDRIGVLRAEMQERGLQAHGSMYVHLLHGFFTHGGYALSLWSRRSLEDLWNEIMAVSSPTSFVRKHTEDNLDSYDLLGAMMSDVAEGDSKSLNDQPNLDSPERRSYFSRPFAMAAVHAFYKCTGRKRMQEVWQEILLRWEDAPNEDKARVQQVVDRMVAEDSKYTH